MDLDLELTPDHLRWDIYENGARDGVDPQKIQQKYGSGDGVVPQNWLHIVTHRVIKTLDKSSSKMYN